MYRELVMLLSGRTLDDKGAREQADALEAAVNDPEDWLADFDDETVRQLSVEMVLSDFVMMGDKIDELHELISGEFAEPLQPFPFRADKEKVLAADYFAWLDAQLAARFPAWELLEWHNDLDDNRHVIIVRRSDTDRILALAGTMGFRVWRATQG